MSKRTVGKALIEEDPEANRAIRAARKMILVGSDFDCFIRLRDAAQYHCTRLIKEHNNRIREEAERFAKLQETKA